MKHWEAFVVPRTALGGFRWEWQKRRRFTMCPLPVPPGQGARKQMGSKLPAAQEPGGTAGKALFGSMAQGDDVRLTGTQRLQVPDC